MGHDTENYLHVMGEHNCLMLESQSSVEHEIAIQLLNDWKWYWVDYPKNGRIIMNEIRYCPYCGAKLEVPDD